MRAGQYGRSNTLFCRCGYRYSSGYPRSKGNVLLGFRFVNGVLRPSSRSNMSYVARSGERIGSSVRMDYHGTLGFRLVCGWCSKRDRDKC